MQVIAPTDDSPQPSKKEDVYEPEYGQVEHTVRDSKGKFLDGGVSGIIELITRDRIAKSPWPGSQEEDCRKDLKLEAEIYRTLGQNRCFVRFFGSDPDDDSIVLEYMTNGSVRNYLQSRNGEISLAQRFEWALRATEGLQVLHSAGIIHCDFSPKNMLLDDRLNLKIIDFGCCSIRGLRSTGMGSVRFILPEHIARPPSVHVDIFSLGGTIYELMTGRAPYEDVSTPQVKQLYQVSQFPDLHGIKCAAIIRDCWLLKVNSAEEAYELLVSAKNHLGLNSVSPAKSA